jgi:hypothetical protein
VVTAKMPEAVMRMMAARLSGTQGPGFDRYKVSAYECTSTNDGARSFPMPDKCVTNEGGGAGGN